MKKTPWLLISLILVVSNGYASVKNVWRNDGGSYSANCESGGTKTITADNGMICTSNGGNPKCSRDWSINDAAKWACSQSMTENYYDHSPAQEFTHSKRLESLLEKIVETANSNGDVSEIRRFMFDDGYGRHTNISSKVDGFSLGGRIMVNGESSYLQVSKRSEFRSKDVSLAFNLFKHYFDEVKGNPVVEDDSQTSVERNSSCTHTTYGLTKMTKVINGYKFTIRKIDGVLTRCGSRTENAQGFTYFQFDK